MATEPLNIYLKSRLMGSELPQTSLKPPVGYPAHVSGVARWILNVVEKRFSYSEKIVFM